MSLLQKASIITTPTAYAEDYLYSIKPAYALGSELVTQFDGVADGTDVATLAGWSAYNTATSKNRYKNCHGHRNSGFCCRACNF